MVNKIRSVVIALLGVLVAVGGAVVVVRGLGTAEERMKGYWMILGGMGGAAIGVMLGVGGLDEGSQGERGAGPVTEGWLELVPRRRWREELRGKGWGAGIFGAGAMVGWGLYLVCGSLWRVEGWVFMAACAGALVWQWWRVRGAWRVARAVRDVRVWVAAGHRQRGEKFGVKAEVVARRPTKWLSLHVRVACVEHRWVKFGHGGAYDHDEEVWRSEWVEGHQIRAKAGEALGVKGELEATTEQAGSGKSLREQNKEGWPYCVWEVRAWVRADKAEGEEGFVVWMG